MAEQTGVWTLEGHMQRLQNANIPHNLGAQKAIKSQSPIYLIQGDQQSNKRNIDDKSQKRQNCNLPSSNKLQQWTIQQEKLLIDLHNQKGNKWVEIARLLHRTDNSVKNHYHSKLRKALRKINKCVTDHMKTECKALKNNLLSRIIQTAESYYTESETCLREEALLAFKLKNNILAFAQLSQQYLSQQQINRIRKLISQISEFNKKYKRHDKTASSQRTVSNKYKGKEIISLLTENSVKDLLDTHKNSKDNTQSFRVIDEAIEEQKVQNQVIVSNATASKNETVSIFSNMNIFNPCQAFYFFKQSFYPIYFSIYPQTSPNLFSGKTSSFSYYIPEDQKLCDQSTWTTMTRIETDFGRNDNLNEACFVSMHAHSQLAQ